MRKIALRGLIGRKRETLLLWIVVVLAFLFLALPTTLITSIEATDAAQRTATYGTWQVMSFGINASTAAELAESAETSVILPLLDFSGADYFQGDNNYYFTTYSPELEDLGQFQLREGRWPQERNEIVLEYARLASLGLKLGDTFAVQCRLNLPMESDHAQANAEAADVAMEAARVRAHAAFEGPINDTYYGGEWEIVEMSGGREHNLLRVGDLEVRLGEAWRWNECLDDDPGAAFLLYCENIYSYMRWLFDDAQRLFDDPQEANGAGVHIEDLTEEQFVALREYFLDSVVMYMFNEAEAEVTNDLLGLDDLTIRVKLSDGPGASSPMELSLLYKYTVCGVMETYTDRWDSGRMNLPSGFVTAENYQLLLDGQQKALEKYPFFNSVNYENMILLRGAGEASAVWREAMKPYNQTVLDMMNFTVPTYQRQVGDPVLDQYGELEGFAYHEQVTFSFPLTDPENPRRSEAKWVNAWLSLSGCEESYITDRLMDGNDGQPDLAFSGYLGQLEEIEEDYFELNDGSYYDMRVGIHGDLDSAVVAFDLDGQRYEISLEDFMSRNFSVNGLAPANWEQCMWLEDLENQADFTALRLNRLAYPSSAEGSGSLLMLVMGILFVTTVCAVFQICFTQIRRRLRRIVLLKSVGSTTGQIAGMMVWEFLYFWATALPVGTALGLLGAWAVAKALGGSQGRTLLLVIDPAVLILALLAGTAALALGMAVPAVMAVGVPLTGRTVRKKPLPPPKRETKQDFFHVTLRGLSAKKGRTAGMFALCTFMMAIAVLCLLLGFRMLGEYRETVMRDGKPDYFLRSPYAMSLRQRVEYLAELEELGVCGDISVYLTGEDIKLNRSGWEGSPLVAAAAGGDEAESCFTDLYTITSEDELFARLQDAATVGRLDPEAFDSGKQVLLLIPMYQDTGKPDNNALSSAEGWARVGASGIDTSYYAEYDGVYSRDEAIQVGDALPITMTFTVLDAASMSYTTQDTEISPTVGAILYYFPGTGIWPLSTGEGWQVVGSPKMLSTLFPEACITRRTMDVRGIYFQQNALSRVSGSYGFTDFYINCREGVSTEAADTALLIYARNHSMEIEVYHESSEKLLRDGLNNVLLVCLLGLTALMLALIIFFNTITSDLEQERGRIGILQALGVSNRQFAGRQLVLGLAASVGALVLANALLWVCVSVFAQSSGAVLENLLWGYPAWAHVGLCVGLAVLITLLFLAPMLRLRRYLPVENIRTKK